MTTTNHLSLPLVQQSQAQKEVTVNEALAKIDALLNTGAMSLSLSTPPTSPNEGDVYIINDNAANDWAGHDKEIAYFDHVWRFITPREGLTLWVGDEDTLYSFDGTAWVASGGGSTSELQNMNLLGINTMADATNKLAVASDAILFNHNGNDSQVKVNKFSESDTASLLFQSNFSGHAEIGLTGDNNFTFKVSPDGSAFHDSFSLDKNNGRLKCHSFFSFGTPEQVTITNGEITVNSSYVAVDSEAGAASDDLFVINGGEDGDILIIKSANDSRTIILRDYGSSALGSNLHISGNWTLDRTRDRIMLQKDGAFWCLLSESSN